MGVSQHNNMVTPSLTPDTLVGSIQYCFDCSFLGTFLDGQDICRIFQFFFAAASKPACLTTAAFTGNLLQLFSTQVFYDITSGSFQLVSLPQYNDESSHSTSTLYITEDDVSGLVSYYCFQARDII